jgi:hypothetical protein
MIHEGTHGIQGLDLLGRKVVMDDGAGLKLLVSTVGRTMTRAEAVPALADHAAALSAALASLCAATQSAWSTGKPEDALANATPYLQAFGHVVLAWIWLDVAQVALQGASGAAAAEPGFVPGKVQACHYFFDFELPKIGAWLAVVASRNPVCREMQDAWF